MAKESCPLTTVYPLYVNGQDFYTRLHFFFNVYHIKYIKFSIVIYRMFKKSCPLTTVYPLYVNGQEFYTRLLFIFNVYHIK